MHDRLVAIQYWGYALHQIQKYEKVINAMQTGLLIDPTRAEFNVLIADAYLKCNQLAQALPYLGAAKYTLENNAVSVVFKNKDSYGPYPTKQIARIYAQVGNFDLAKKEAEEGKAKWPNDPEFQILLDELEKLKKIEVGFNGALPSEDIVFSTPPVTAYEWDGDIYKTQAMGGSETACIEVAQWIKKLTGRNVIVFNMRKDAKIVEGVQYRSNAELNDYMARNKPYIHIAWRHNIKVTDAPTFIWSHDLQTQFAEFTDRYIKIMCLTPWHARFLSLTQGVPMDKIFLTRNGLVPEKFEGLDKVEKVKNRFVFGSSPDRGLERAIRVLKEVRKEFPDVTLSVHYGIEHLPKYGHQELHDRLAKEFEENKEWLTYHGKTEQKDLMKSYATAQYCIQPSDFLETSMISCIELVACGVYVMLRKVGGAVDTLTPFVDKGVAEFIDERCESDEEYAIYIERAKEAIREEKYKLVKTHMSDFPTWEGVARQWIAELPQIIAKGL
jgi:glycosyltransferase involved in cell wall biosynthesis